jgi:molybdopterin converting factor small subunit
MRVYVRLAEPFWRAAGQRDLTLELENESRVAGLLARLLEAYPDLEREMYEAPPNIFVGEQEARPDTPLANGDRVYLVWPVAGG